MTLVTSPDSGMDHFARNDSPWILLCVDSTDSGLSRSANVLKEEGHCISLQEAVWNVIGVHFNQGIKNLVHSSFATLYTLQEENS